MFIMFTMFLGNKVGWFFGVEKKPDFVALYYIAA